MKDIELLSLLETNARLSVRDLSDILLEEEENIIQRMDSLEKRKIICGYHTVINWDKASRGRKVMAIIEVGVTPQRDYGYDKIARTIARYPEVDTMYLLSGKSEFMCMVYGKSMYDVASFVADKIACIDAVKSTVTLFVLKQYKESGIILEDEKVYGTVHIAFGTNTSFGGTNKADCHMDGIILEPTLYFDDRLIIDKGKFVV